MEANALLNPERRMLRTMQQKEAVEWSLSEILTACEWTDQAVAVGAGHGLTNAGLVKTSETSSVTVRLDHEGLKAKESGLLEQRLWNWISNTSEPTMANLQTAFERHEAGPGVGLLKRLGVQLENGAFHSQNPADVTALIEARTAFLNVLPCAEEELLSLIHI